MAEPEALRWSHQAGEEWAYCRSWLSNPATLDIGAGSLSAVGAVPALWARPASRPQPPRCQEYPPVVIAKHVADKMTCPILHLWFPWLPVGQNPCGGSIEKTSRPQAPPPHGIRISGERP